MGDVAKRVGVSRQLVGLVFQNAPGVGATTAAKIRAAAKEIGYRPNLAAQSLRRDSSNYIGFMFHSDHSSMQGILPAMYKYAKAAGYQILMSVVSESHSENDAIEELIGHRCEGIVLSSSHIPISRLQRLAREIPLVSLGRRLENVRAGMVSSNGEAGVFTITKYLIGLGHTDIAPYGMGSRGSRGAAAGGGVLRLAGLALRKKLLVLAAHLLNLNSADGLEMRAGLVIRRVAEGELETGLSLAALARIAHLEPLRQPPGMAPGLHHIEAFDPPAMTYSNSTHACVVEIDTETGALTILRHVIAEDAGTLINPMIVEGQTHGATAMGLSGAMMEHAAYGADGQMLAGSFMDYAMARAGDLPCFEVSHHPTPAIGIPAGIKGMAEGGTMGGIGAVMNAVNDALAGVGAYLPAQPATPDRIWAALQHRKIV
jgi:hypothetical protein